MRWAGETGAGAGSNAVPQSAVGVVGRVRQVLLIDEEERRLVQPVLCRGGVPAEVGDGGVGGGGGRGRIQAIDVVAALRRLGRAVQAGRHEAVLVLGPCDLEGGGQTLVLLITRHPRWNVSETRWILLAGTGWNHASILKRVWKGEAKLGNDGTKLQSITFKADQSVFLAAS